mgnify:CR=1 FL=1
MIRDHDTIAAPATAAGGALAVIRISGEEALRICDRIFRGREPLAAAAGYTVHYGEIVDEGRVLDDVLVTVFRAPRSYTGEDAAEISCHGSQYIVSEILRLLTASGARMAGPGEFTIRAYLAGKLDLSQAEAVADIIASSSRAAHALAANQMRGGYSDALEGLCAKLLELTALLELELDFSEEEVEFADRAQLREAMQRIGAHIDALRNSFTLGNAIKEGVAVAITGAPNVGKSTLLNRLLNEERVLVSDIAGTTRDAIDSYFENEQGKYVFIDTAGMRKKSKVDDVIERYSVLRSLAAVERSRVCVIMIDATVGFTEQDSKVAGYAHDQGKACIIAVNKWDAVEKDSYTMDKMRKQLEEDFSFMSYAPILFISAKTGQRLDKLFETIQYVDVQNGTRIPTGALNEMLARSTARVQPPSDKGKRLKIFYITQSSTRPPTFVAFVNQKALFHFSYQRYIENQIRENFGLTGTPMRLLIREHGDGSAR